MVAAALAMGLALVGCGGQATLVARKNSIKQIAGCTHDANHRAQTLRPRYKRRRCYVGTRHLMWEGEFAVDRARQGPTTYAAGRDCNDQTMNATLYAGEALRVGSASPGIRAGSCRSIAHKVR